MRPGHPVLCMNIYYWGSLQMPLSAGRFKCLNPFWKSMEPNWNMTISNCGAFGTP